jgi:hypothetical protein
MKNMSASRSSTGAAAMSKARGAPNDFKSPKALRNAAQEAALDEERDEGLAERQRRLPD